MQERLDILFVPDIGLDARAIADALRRVAREVHLRSAQSAEEFAAALHEQVPQLVVIAAGPTRGALAQALPLLQSLTPGPPVLLIDALPEGEVVHQGVVAGIYQRLGCEDLEHLEAAVQRCLQGAAPPRPQPRGGKELFADIGEAIVSVDQDQNIVLFNPAAERLFGYAAAEVKGQPLSLLLPERHRVAHAAYVAEFGMSGTSRRAMGGFGRVSGRHRSGEEFTLDATISQWRGEHGRIYTAVLRPVKSEATLEDSRAVLAAIVESAQDAIVGKTLDGIIRSWSPGAERLFGYRAEEIIGRPVTVLLPPDRLVEESLILERIRRGERVETFESKRLRKDGTTVDVSLTVSPIRGQDGRITGASKIARDISARVAAERRMRRLTAFYAALSQTNEALLKLRDPDALYREICRVCVEHGKATMAFVALVRGARAEFVALAGAAQSYLDSLAPELAPVRLDAPPDAQGPIGIAVRTGQRYVANDFAGDPLLQPWREAAARFGTQAAAFIPFRRGGAVEGVLVLHVAEPDFFDSDLIALLEEIAADVSFALDNFDRDAARTLAEQALRRSEAWLVNAQIRAKLGSWEQDLSTGQVHWSEQMFRLLDWDPARGVPSIEALLRLIHPQDRAVFRATHEHAARFRTAASCELRSNPDSGPERWFSANVEGYADASGRVTVLAGTVQDITERKQHESRIEHLGTHDSLTDLPNARVMRDRIAHAVVQARRSGTPVALIYVDLDRFKSINDGYGHLFGDAVLRAVAQRLVTTLRECDTVARLGGDEFLVLLGELKRAGDAHVVTQKVLEAVRGPLVVEGRTLHLTASLGVSLYPQHGADVDTLIGNADVAMYLSKDRGGNGFHFFTAELSEATRLRVRLENDLRDALDAGQLHLVYQAKADLASGSLYGCEALLRWTHPELGEISPAQFIPIAEDTGLIGPIGDWVLRTACRQNRAWRDAGLAPVAVSVNLSARQFRYGNLVDRVSTVLGQTGMPPDSLELELTESILADDTEHVVEAVGALKQFGVGLSIDDFGTGFSSLAYLKRFRVDTLKIDQSFIRNMLTEHDDATIATAVIALAHSLRMTAIAEGVETAEQLRVLQASGCDAIQGYFVSRPLGPVAFAHLLRQGWRGAGEALAPAQGRGQAALPHSA